MMEVEGEKQWKEERENLNSVWRERELDTLGRGEMGESLKATC